MSTLPEIIETPFGKYEPKPGDEKVTVFDSRDGVSVLSQYPENRFPDKRILIKVVFSEDGNQDVVGTVNAVKYKEKEGDGYQLIDAQEDGQLTNFSFSQKEGVKFSSPEKYFSYRGSPIKKSISELIDTLAYNHLYARKSPDLFASRISRRLLGALFWMLDSSHDKDVGMKVLFGIKDQKVVMAEEIKEPDLFFKYFKITRNLLLLGLVLAVVCLSVLINKGVICWDDLDVTNIVVLALSAIPLFLLEKVSNYLLGHVREFENGKKNFIRSLFMHRYNLVGREFDLIWKK